SRKFLCTLYEVYEFTKYLTRHVLIKRRAPAITRMPKDTSCTSYQTTTRAHIGQVCPWQANHISRGRVVPDWCSDRARPSLVSRESTKVSRLLLWLRPKRLLISQRLIPAGATCRSSTRMRSATGSPSASPKICRTLSVS